MESALFFNLVGGLGHIVKAVVFKWCERLQIINIDAEMSIP